MSVIGANGGYDDVNNLEMAKGRFINERDLEGVKNVAVVSDKLAETIFK